ncbi:hypothetical protein DACRYDRAFT_21217 [Dacryopinax primogenitus]|uniref:Uncharacterized protein n=1 Tax=Dacryopinax primogenitus (strain DJM 731) TaxID=1858805 RepID=M5G520_DACPD|nr:uncharacterized protein DACRYDRAFT_21217 [Dacryopinax primogenitus]EJU03759.1 hypothetical protein DACRYDRAFT_21217 [Dacryopinax primogenitus]
MARLSCCSQGVNLRKGASGELPEEPRETIPPLAGGRVSHSGRSSSLSHQEPVQKGGNSVECKDTPTWRVSGWNVKEVNKQEGAMARMQEWVS